MEPDLYLNDYNNLSVNNPIGGIMLRMSKLTFSCYTNSVVFVFCDSEI